MLAKDLLLIVLPALLLSLSLKWFRQYRSQQSWRQCTQRLGQTQVALTPFSQFSSDLIDDQFEIRRPEFPQSNRRRSNALYWISQGIFSAGIVGTSASVTILIKGGVIKMPLQLGIAAAVVVCFVVGYLLGRASHACKPLSDHTPVTRAKRGNNGGLYRRLKACAAHAYHRVLLKHIGFDTIGIYHRKNVGPFSTYRESQVLETFISKNGTTLIQMGLSDLQQPVFFVQVFSQLTNHQTVTTTIELKARYPYPGPEDSRWLLEALERQQASLLQKCQTQRCRIALINRHNFEHVVQIEELQSRASLLPSTVSHTTEKQPWHNATLARDGL